MHKILSVSHDPLVGCWQQLLLENGGYAVVTAMDAAEATPFIDAKAVDAILLGSAVRVDDRISLALLGVSSNIPVVCACGLQSDSGCPVVHVLPSEPKRLLAAFAEVLGNRGASRAVAA